jgi:hypothetical protein
VRLALTGSGRSLFWRLPLAGFAEMIGLSVRRGGRSRTMNEAQGYVAGWGTVALINAGLAQAKNRSGLNWFLLSLLLGPLATLLLVAFFDKRRDD